VQLFAKGHIVTSAPVVSYFHFQPFAFSVVKKRKQSCAALDA
jgi:hypothetical protein